MPWDRIQSRWRRPYYRPTPNEATTFNPDYEYIDGQDAQLFVPEAELDGENATPGQLDVILNGGAATQP